MTYILSMAPLWRDWSRSLALRGRLVGICCERYQSHGKAACDWYCREPEANSRRGQTLCDQ